MTHEPRNAALDPEEIAPTDRQQREWVLTRRRGLLRYVVFHGILLYGLPCGVMSMLGRYFSFPINVGWTGLPGEIYRCILFVVFFGTAMSLWTWRSNLKRFAHEH